MNHDAIPQSLEEALVDSVASENLQSVAVDLAEIGIDSLLESGVGKDIPVIGSLLSLYKAGRSVRQQLFIRKVLNFLRGVSTATSQEREKLAEELISHHGSATQAGAAVILLLDRLDELSKPALVARLFVACAKGAITVDEVLRYSAYVDRMYIGDIRALSRLGSGPGYTTLEQEALLSAGLMVQRLQNPPKPPRGHTVTESSMYYGKEPELQMLLSEHAKKMAELLFDAKMQVVEIKI